MAFMDNFRVVARLDRKRLGSSSITLSKCAARGVSDQA